MRSPVGASIQSKFRCRFSTLRYTFAQALPSANSFRRSRLSNYAAHRMAASPDHELISLEITMKRILYAGLVTLLVASSGYAAPGSTISGAIAGPDGTPFRAAFVRAQNVKTKMTMIDRKSTR